MLRDTHLECQDDIFVVGTWGNCQLRESHMCSLGLGSLEGWRCQRACRVVSSSWPWSHQGLFVSRLFIFFEFKSVLINQDYLDFFRDLIRILNLGALEFAVECRDVTHSARGAPVHGICFVRWALFCYVAGFHSVSFLGDPLLSPIGASGPHQRWVDVRARSG